MEQTTYYHEKICLCKKCKGTGIETFYAKSDLLNRHPLQRKCPQCNGTGRVVVSGTRVLNVVPYEPGQPTDTNGTV